jgi:hypothetical protein
MLIKKEEIPIAQIEAGIEGGVVEVEFEVLLSMKFKPKIKRKIV